MTCFPGKVIHIIPNLIHQISRVRLGIFIPSRQRCRNQPNLMESAGFSVGFAPARIFYPHYPHYVIPSAGSLPPSFQNRPVVLYSAIQLCRPAAVPYHSPGNLHRRPGSLPQPGSHAPAGMPKPEDPAALPPGSAAKPQIPAALLRGSCQSLRSRRLRSGNHANASDPGDSAPGIMPKPQVPAALLRESCQSLRKQLLSPERLSQAPDPGSSAPGIIPKPGTRQPCSREALPFLYHTERYLFKAPNRGPSRCAVLALFSGLLSAARALHRYTKEERGRIRPWRKRT